MWYRETTKYHKVYFDRDTRENEISEETFFSTIRFLGMKISSSKHFFACTKNFNNDQPGFKPNTK